MLSEKLRKNKKYINNGKNNLHQASMDPKNSHETLGYLKLFIKIINERNRILTIFLVCQKALNIKTKISHQLFDYKITFVNSKH